MRARGRGGRPSESPHPARRPRAAGPARHGCAHGAGHERCLAAIAGLIIVPANANGTCQRTPSVKRPHHAHRLSAAAAAAARGGLGLLGVHSSAPIRPQRPNQWWFGRLWRGDANGAAAAAPALLVVVAGIYWEDLVVF